MLPLKATNLAPDFPLIHRDLHKINCAHKAGFNPVCFVACTCEGCKNRWH